MSSSVVSVGFGSVRGELFCILIGSLWSSFFEFSEIKKYITMLNTIVLWVERFVSNVRRHVRIYIRIHFAILAVMRFWTRIKYVCGMISEHLIESRTSYWQRFGYSSQRTSFKANDDLKMCGYWNCSTHKHRLLRKTVNYTCYTISKCCLGDLRGTRVVIMLF